MSNLRLFTLHPTTFLVELDKEWISTIKEFKALIVRDKGVKGDTQARKKLQAQREFTFIYHFCDYRSQFWNYSEKDRYVKALKNAELDVKLDITKDKELQEAVEVYKALQETPALELLTELKDGLHTAKKVVKKIREDLEAKLEAADFDTLEAEMRNGKAVMVDPVEKITTRLQALMNIGNALPKTLTTIKDLEEDVKKELQDSPVLRGGARKGTREDAPITQDVNPLPQTTNFD